MFNVGDIVRVESTNSVVRKRIYEVESVHQDGTIRELRVIDKSVFDKYRAIGVVWPAAHQKDLYNQKQKYILVDKELYVKPNENDTVYRIGDFCYFPKSLGIKSKRKYLVLSIDVNNKPKSIKLIYKEEGDDEVKTGTLFSCYHFNHNNLEKIIKKHRLTHVFN